MNCRRFLLLLFVIPFACRLVSAQDVLSVDKLTLDQHIDHRFPPIYPPIAKAVRVQGTVDFAVRIGVTGNVESMKVVSGHPMLQQAAMDCLKQWTFHPFEKDGKPVPASGTVSIEFSLGKDGPTPGELNTAGKYFPVYFECMKEVSEGKDFSRASATCKNAADIANEYPPDQRFIEKREVFVWAAWALLHNGDLQTALTYAEKAVDVVKLGHDDNSGSNAAYGIKGIVEGKLGNLIAADQDLTVAEDYERKGIAWAESEKLTLGNDYKRAIVQDLRFHAQVLQGLSRPEEAQKKLDEAAKYN
jgi:TonB family protein